MQIFKKQHYIDCMFTYIYLGYKNLEKECTLTLRLCFLLGGDRFIKELKEALISLIFYHLPPNTPCFTSPKRKGIKRKKLAPRQMGDTTREPKLKRMCNNMSAPQSGCWRLHSVIYKPSVEFY